MTRHPVLVVLGALALLVALTVPATAEPGEQVPATSTDLWFAELHGPPTADGGSPAAVQAEQAGFRSEATRAGVRYRERYAFGTLWNGLSLETDARGLAGLARLPQVKALFPVATVDALEPEDGDRAELATALAMTGADAARHDLGLTGSGVRVAVMDTGIDYRHPDLGGCFGPTCRVPVGWDFVGDDFNAQVPGAVPAPDADPMDCNGHGTHVAGIVGADAAGPDGVTGVAPDVTFGAYKVFGCEGSTTADVMIAAMERALADGMHVLNMSIGSAFAWPQYPTATASDRLVDRGVTVVASIGNSGADGLYSAGAPGVGRKVIGVASFDNSHVSLATFTVTPDATAIGYSAASAAPAPPTSGSLPLARTGTRQTTGDACAALPAGSLSGRAALVRRGTCSFHQKALNAQQAGAAAVVLYNNAPGRFSATVAGAPAITIPVVSVSADEGALLDGRLADGPVELTWTDRTGSFLNPTGGLVSSFSSYGLTHDLAVKPDLGAPGGLIRSSYPLGKGGYATLSGTSMAAPHVAGAVALLLQARPRTPSQAVRAVLQNAADPRPWWGNPGLGFRDQVHRQGAGMLDVPGAVTARTSLAPAALALGESETGPATRAVAITNTAASERTFTLSHAPALSTRGSTFSPSVMTGFAAVTFSADEVTVPAGGTRSVDVTVTANPDLPEHAQYGGYLVVTADDGEVTRVPYAGLKGDYQTIRALTPTSWGFPWLARLQGSSYQREPGASGARFTMVGDDIPRFLLHLDHAARRVRLTVRDAATGRNWHRAHDASYVARNSTASSYSAIPWDGVTVHGNRQVTVPDGSYVAVLEVVKALGDDADPEHVETWTSPPFTIARP